MKIFQPDVEGEGIGTSSKERRKRIKFSNPTSYLGRREQYEN